MQRNLIVNLILLLLVIIFAIQNYAPVIIKLYFWEVMVSTGFLIALVFVAGVILGVLTVSYANYRKRHKLKEEALLKEAPPEENTHIQGN